LSLVFWNGAGCALQGFTVLVEPHMKELAQKEHTGQFHWFLCCVSSLKSYATSSHLVYFIKLQALRVT